MKKEIVIVMIVLVLMGICIWGLIGEQQAQKIGTDCNVGIKDTLCWVWEKNIIGEIQDEIEDRYG